MLTHMNADQTLEPAPAQTHVLAAVQAHDALPETRLLDGEPSTVVALSRVLACTPERAWELLTTPEGLAAWSPCVPDRPLDSPGPAPLKENPEDDAVDGTVEVAESPARLVQRWGPEHLDWRLAPMDQGTQLDPVMHCISDEMAAACGAGWHVCLAVLEVLARGENAERVVGYDAFAYGWAGMNASYGAALGQSA